MLKSAIIPQTRREWFIVAICAAIVAVMAQCVAEPVPAVVQAPAIELRSVPTTTTVTMPPTADTVRITRILRVRDSTRHDLAATGVRIVARIDTVIHWQYGSDTIRLACDEISRTADVSIRRSPMTVASSHRQITWYSDVSVGRTTEAWIPVAAVGAQIHIGRNAIVYCEGIAPITSSGILPAIRAGMRLHL